MELFCPSKLPIYKSSQSDGFPTHFKHSCGFNNEAGMLPGEVPPSSFMPFWLGIVEECSFVFKLNVIVNDAEISLLNRNLTVRFIYILCTYTLTKIIIAQSPRIALSPMIAMNQSFYGWRKIKKTYSTKDNPSDTLDCMVTNDC